MNLRKLLLVVSVLLASVTLWAQSRTVTGTVVGTDGLAIPGAYVLVKGTTTGTVTDMDGKYRINVPEGSETLVFRIIGMVDQEQDINGRTEVNATMETENEELNEVIVVAYGTSTKGTYTGSAAAVSSEKLSKRQVSNVTNALAGEMAGVQTLSSNGQPGEGAKVRIRGVGSINAGMAPLYVVDGVPFDGDLSSLNANDIENITVLKDAASTSLYGARGANGIIMITTKSGSNSKGGDANINFVARWGANSRQFKNYDVLTNPAEVYEKEYAALRNYFYYDKDDTKGNDAMSVMYANSNLMGEDNVFGAYADIFTVPQGELLVNEDGKINPKATLGYNDGENYYIPDDWSDATFNSQQRQQYDLTISGGNETGTYYISAGYLKDGGIIDDSELTRFSSRFKGDLQAKKWLKVGCNVSYNKVKNRYPGEQTTTNSSGNAFYIANYIAPIYPLYIRDAKGNIMKENGHTIYDYGDGKYSKLNRNFMSISNPIGDLKYNHTEYNKDTFSGSAFAELTPITGLTITARYGINVDNVRYNDLGNAYMGQSASYEGTATQRSSRTYGLDQQYVADYNFNVADVNNFDITVGYDGYQYKFNRLHAYGTHLYNPESYFVSNATADQAISGYQNTYATKGFFGRVNYNYDSKYLFNVSVRRDASSRFIGNNRWGTFFALSAGWLLSSEEFMSGIDWVNVLKLKGSFGQQGNDDLLTNGEANYYPYADQYGVSGANGSYSDGVLIYKGNPDLTWETSTTYNVGFDFDLFNNKLSGSVEYFGRKSQDMLYNKPVSGSAGYSSIPMNVGSLTNSGVEIDLNSNILTIGDDFNWSINANATFIKNKINELHPDLQGEMIDGNQIYVEGQSMYRLYLVQYAGVDKETGSALYYAEDEEGNKITTTSYSVARNYRKPTSDLLPKVYGGFGTKLEFWGFDFSTSFSYQLGGKILDSGYQNLMHAGASSDAGRNWHKDIRKAWTPNNKNTDVPKLNFGDDDCGKISDRWIISSNYLALNNITFGYTIPKSLTEKWYISNARVFFVADNLALWSKREGLDPRQSYTTSTTARYTALRTISGGISITF
ncbi:MAG: SusC/RagA family TonB-linked outer membrane protein [Bacteroidales bacterium]|nr:SusC/RagA family TonB-linked outer membrane protein [Bacteroidales bacterium]